MNVTLKHIPTICSDFGAPQNKVCHCFHCFPITSWQIDGETVETVTDFIFWAPKSLQMEIAAMKLRHLLLGRKVMTNLDSILKRRDITLPTKVRLVKAMVFPVVMYGCENWTIKKVEC